MADDRDEWTSGRLQDRFDDINRRFDDVEHDVRVIMPLVRQMGGAEADIDGLQRDFGSLRTAFEELAKGFNGLERHNRAEQLKYLAYILGPALVVAAGIIFSGKGP